MPTAQTNIFRPRRWTDLGPVGVKGAATLNDPHKFQDEAGQLHYGKVGSPDHPYLVANEIVTARLGQLMGVHVPDVFPTRFRGRTWVMATAVAGKPRLLVDLDAVTNSTAARADIARILCLDLLAMNRDRHWGNLVFLAGTRIAAIDHDRALFGWPQNGDAAIGAEHARGGACATHWAATPDLVQRFALSDADLEPALAEIEGFMAADIEMASEGLTPAVVSDVDLVELRRVASERSCSIRALSQQLVARTDLPFVVASPSL